MAIGRRESERQESLWVAAGEVAWGLCSPFYTQLNGVLAAAGLARWAEECGGRFYTEKAGRPVVPAGGTSGGS